MNDPEAHKGPDFDREVLDLVKEGLEQAASGQLSDGPDGLKDDLEAVRKFNLVFD